MEIFMDQLLFYDNMNFLGNDQEIIKKEDDFRENNIVSINR